MKIVNFSAGTWEYGTIMGVGVELENGKRHAVKFELPMDTEELPELLAQAGKVLRSWARKQEPPAKP